MIQRRAVWRTCFLATTLVAFLVDTNAAQEKAPHLNGLEQAWSLEGAWASVVCDENKGLIYALGMGGKCVEVDLTGKTQREINLPQDSGAVMRLAQLTPEGGQALFTFTVWGEELRAHDLDGKQLWSYVQSSGIDDVWAGDLDGDSSDEVIVGFNGFTGLHVLNSKGQLLWETDDIGNVWSVCVGDVRGEGKPQVVTTSALGQVHIFGGNGKNRKDIETGFYASMVRVGKLSEKDKAATILVAGPSSDGNAMPRTVIVTAISGEGRKKWTLELPAGMDPHGFLNSACIASRKSWFAMGLRDGQVQIVGFEKGEIIASVDDQGTTPEVGWVTSEAGATLLLVATGSKLNAFRVAEPK